MMKVLIADDQRIIRAAVKDLLAAEPEVDVIGEAVDGCQAVELSRINAWDVVILDIAMPGTNGISALSTIKLEQPSLPIVMLSTTTDLTTVRHCFALGADAFVAKQSAFGELIKAVRAALLGEKYLCEVIRAELAYLA